MIIIKFFLIFINIHGIFRTEIMISGSYGQKRKGVAFMTMFHRNTENAWRDRHFFWTLVLCVMYMIGVAGNALSGLANLIAVCIRPAAETVVIKTAEGLRFDLLDGYAQLRRETAPLMTDSSDINGKVFAVAFLLLNLIAYNLPLLFIAWKGFQILHTMKHSWSPFVPEIAEHICWIGRTSLFIGLFHKLSIQVGMSAVIDHKVHFENPYELSWILAGVILLLVSDIFKKGCILQKEVDETL